MIGLINLYISNIVIALNSNFQYFAIAKLNWSNTWNMMIVIINVQNIVVQQNFIGNDNFA